MLKYIVLMLYKLRIKNIVSATPFYTKSVVRGELRQACIITAKKRTTSNKTLDQPVWPAWYELVQNFQFMARSLGWESYMYNSIPTIIACILLLFNWLLISFSNLKKILFQPVVVDKFYWRFSSCFTTVILIDIQMKDL